MPQNKKKKYENADAMLQSKDINHRVKCRGIRTNWVIASCDLESTNKKSRPERRVAAPSVLFSPITGQPSLNEKISESRINLRI